MAASNINVVVLTGNLTRDPELRSLPSGTSVCDMRIAVNTRRKNGATGEWEDKPTEWPAAWTSPTSPRATARRAPASRSGRTR